MCSIFQEGVYAIRDPAAVDAYPARSDEAIAGALEFTLPGKPKVTSAELSLNNALCEVKWDNGLALKTYVHATEPVGWFRFENISGSILPELVPPAYQGKLTEGATVNSLVGNDLARLGYKQGTVRQKKNEITYEQEGWGGFTYRISVRWKHLKEAMGYLHHLDANKPNYKRYTKQYFGADGLTVPGVTTLDGTEMGGWIQYSLSPTVSAWLAQHYYLQWKYSMDREFLRESAYPWLREVCTFLEQIATRDENGFRQLPLSSSPEINDNRISARFLKNTNYDLALMKFAFGAAAELAGELDIKGDAARWKEVLDEFGDYSLTEKTS